MSDIAYKGLNFSVTFKEFHPPLPLSFWASNSFLKTYQRLTGTDVGFIYEVVNSELTGYMESDGSVRIAASLKTKLSKEWIDQEFKIFEEHYSRIISRVEEIRSGPGVYTREELAEILQFVFDELGALYPYSNAFYLLSSEIETQLIEKLNSLNPGGNGAEFLSKLSVPIKETFLMKFSRDLELLANKIKAKHGTQDRNGVALLYKKDSEIKDNIDNFQKKYFCLASINAGVRTSESFFPDIVDKMSEHEKDKMPDVPAEALDLLHQFRVMIYAKDELSTYVIPFVTYGLESVWNQTALFLKISREEMDQLLISELIELLKTGNIGHLKDLVKNRKEATFFFHIPFKPTEVIEGEMAVKEISLIKSQISNASLGDISEIKGKVGSVGKATGPVHVITNSAQISTFKDGHVLVAVYTAPEFVPAMQKAIATVTDTGGITCHAAIVSRELGKPCVVGTKIATRVLKDGDVVEVDAEKGTVKIIK
jgi:phosphoenolpyruvate synthase/pyruvate phosphate dikinase